MLSDYVRSQIAAHLPVHVRWLVNRTPLDFDFSRSQRPLKPLLASEVNGDLEPEWSVLDLFGEEDHAEGGGASPFLGVHRNSGQIFGLDVERESSEMFLLNSDVDRFIKTFQRFDSVLREGSRSGDLHASLHEIDPEVFEVSEWRLLVDCLGE